MKVKYVGFGGYMEVPCYEDENGKLYFDENNGKTDSISIQVLIELNGMKSVVNHVNRVTEPVECDDPFVRHQRKGITCS